MHGGGVGVSGRMGENHGGLRTGWLAAFGTEGYEGEPPLMEELGVNFGHIKGKVCVSKFFFPSPPSFYLFWLAHGSHLKKPVFEGESPSRWLSHLYTLLPPPHHYPHYLTPIFLAIKKQTRKKRDANHQSIKKKRPSQSSTLSHISINT